MKFVLLFIYTSQFYINKLFIIVKINIFYTGFIGKYQCSISLVVFTYFTFSLVPPFGVRSAIVAVGFSRQAHIGLQHHDLSSVSRAFQKESQSIKQSSSNDLKVEVTQRSLRMRIHLW